MSSVFYLRPIEPAIEPADVQAMASQAGGCFNLHRVDWRVSFLAADGARMLCWYEAPDAESARNALRELGSDMNAVWAGIASGTDETETPARGIVVEHHFTEPLDAGTREELLDRIRGALKDSGGQLERSFVSRNGAHLVCLIGGAEEGAVSQALQGIEPAPAAIWPCATVVPELPGN